MGHPCGFLCSLNIALFCQWPLLKAEGEGHLINFCSCIARAAGGEKAVDIKSPSPNPILPPSCIITSSLECISPSLRPAGHSQIRSFLPSWLRGFRDFRLLPRQDDIRQKKWIDFTAANVCCFIKWLMFHCFHCCFYDLLLLSPVCHFRSEHCKKECRNNQAK